MARPLLAEQERWGSGCGWRRSCGLNQSILQFALYPCGSLVSSNSFHLDSRFRTSFLSLVCRAGDLQNAELKFLCVGWSLLTQQLPKFLVSAVTRR